MDPQITHRDIVEAVNIAARGINGLCIVTNDESDRIMPTLIAAHSAAGQPANSGLSEFRCNRVWIGD